MAKKDKHGFEDFDDFEDFSMFDEGMGEGGYKSTTKKGKAREAVGLLTGGFTSGVKKSLFTRNFYQSLVSSALPKEYSSALEKGLEVKDNVEDLYDTAYRETDKINDKLTKGVKPIVDKYGDKLPKRMSKPLRTWTRNVRSTGDWTKENKDELESVAALNDIFNKREQTRSIKSTGIEAKVQTGIAKNNMTLTMQMLGIQQQQVAYQDQVDATWKRKTLELQYKQFFVQRKLLDVQQQSLAFSKVVLPEIMKSVALPDLVKAKGTEVGSRMVTEKLYGAAINQFSGLPYSVLRNLSNNVTKKMRAGSRNLQQDLAGGLSELHAILEAGQGASNMGGARDNTREAGDMAGQMSGGSIGKYLGKKFKKKYGDNEKVMKGADMLSAGMRRVPRMMNGMVKDGDTGNTFLDMIIELTDARQIMSTRTGTIMKNQEDELDSQIYFDLLTKKSITEVIPGYLTRIHHEIKSLRTGDTSHSYLDFDFNKGVFSDSATMGKTMRDKVLGSRQVQALDSVHKELSSALGLNADPDKEGDVGLSAELQHQLLRQMSLASLNNTDFTFKSLLDDKEGVLSEDQQNEFREFLLKKYDLTIEDDDLDAGFIDKIKTGISAQQGQSKQAAKAQRDIMDAMDKLQAYVSNPTGIMNKAAQRGQIKYGLDLDIHDENNGEYVLNKEKLIDALMNGRTDVTDESGDFKIEEEEKDTATRRFFNAKGEEIKKKWNELTESEKALNVKEKIEGAKNSVKNGASDARDSVVNKTTAIRNEIKDNGVKDTVKSKIDAVAESRRIEEFRLKFNRAKFDEMKDKFSESDKLARAYDLVAAKFGENQISISNIRATYETSREFRSIMNELKAIESELDGPKEKEDSKTDAVITNAKAKIHNTINAVSETGSSVSSTVKSSATTTTANIKNKLTNASTTVEASESDYEEAEDYADNLIQQNGIDDKDGNIKHTLIKDFFTRRFGNTRVFDAYVKTGKAGGGAIARAKKGINVLKSKGGTGATGEAMSILFELSKWSAKAANIATKPSRAALKLVPWGLKKLVGTVIDTVNFKHIEHGLWLEGEKEPRLLKTGLMGGRYINGEGKVVEKPKDLIGNIFDAMATPEELIMTQAEYKGGLFDSTGKLIYKPPTLVGRAVSGLVRLPFKILKASVKLAGKLTMGYLNVTTKPVTWLINKIMQEKRIDPKLHAELAQLGLTDQTNQKIEELTELIDKRFPDKEEAKYNDKDGDGDRDGSLADVKEKREKDKTEAKEKKKGLLASILERKKKKKKGGDDDEDEDGFQLMDILGKGKTFSKLAGLAKNPYVLGGAAIASMIGWEGMTDEGKNKDPEDVANMMLPDSMKDSKMARIGVRLSEKLANLVLMPIKGQLKGVVKTIEYASRAGKWLNRKEGKMKDATTTFLSAIPGATAKFLFGRSAGKALDKLMNVDNINPLFRFRMAQYGFKHTDKEGVQAILKLEDDILKDLIVATDTAPAKISDAVTIEQSASYFGVSVNDEDDLTEWIAWFGNRFRPVFLSNVTVMHRMKYDSKQLHQIDSLMGKKDKTDFIKKVDFNRGDFNPYDKPTNPMGTEWTLDIVGQGKLDNVKEDSLAEIDDMPDDKVKLKEQQDRTAKRENKLVDKAKAKHKDTKAEKRFDPYAAIDSINFKSIFGLKKQDRSINDVLAGKADPAVGQGGKFGGAGAGGAIATAEAARQARIEEHGAIGEMFRGLGGLVMNKANAAPFIPEAAGKAAGASKGVTVGAGTFKANTADGVGSLGTADKPMAAVRNLRDSARTESAGNASKHVKNAFIAAGYKFTAPANAAEYPSQALPQMGFAKIDNNAEWAVGDVMVFSTNKSNRNGHIQIYDGANWISDHIQQSWQPMEGDVPSFTLWRDVNFSAKGKLASKTTKDVKDVATIDNPTALDKSAPSKTKDSSSFMSKAMSTLEKMVSGSKDAIAGIMDRVKSSAPVAAVSNAVGGGVDKVSNFLASMTGSQKEWQMSVYKAFKTAGFSEQQSRILTAEIGRENSYNPKYLFAGHADPHKGSNLGMLSWQGDRKPKLVAHLKAAGVLDRNNNMVPGQAALDAQAGFIMWEMRNTHKGVGSTFLANPNISYADGAYLIGKKYILWRIDDPKYAPGGKKNRDGFYNMLLKQLEGGGKGVVATAASKANAVATKAAAGVVNPINKVADKIVGAVTGKSKDTATTPKEVASTTDNAKVKEIAGDAKPAIAARYCRRNAKSGSIGLCATYVRKGLQAANYVFQSQASAYMYHTNGTMLTMGFVQISGQSARQVGDVIILNRNLGAGKKHGHIAIFDGSNWVSDFVQQSWSPYRAKVFPWSIWRDKNHLNGASTASGWSPGNTAPNSTASGAVLSGGDTGTFGASGGTPVPYNPIKMKYNDYGDIDSQIKKSYKDGSTAAIKDAPAATADNAAIKDNKAAAVKDKKAEKATASVATAAAKVDTKAAEAAKAVAKAVETKAPTPAAKSEAAKYNKVELQAKKIEQQVAKNLTQQMSETESRKNSEDLSASTQTLRESLKVQKQMLDKLTSMDKHLENVLKGQAARNVTESGGEQKQTTAQARPNKQQDNKVRRPGRDEPMSMSKMA